MRPAGERPHQSERLLLDRDNLGRRHARLFAEDPEERREENLLDLPLEPVKEVLSVLKPRLRLHDPERLLILDDVDHARLPRDRAEHAVLSRERGGIDRLRCRREIELDLPVERADVGQGGMAWPTAEDFARRLRPARDAEWLLLVAALTDEFLVVEGDVARGEFHILPRVARSLAVVAPRIDAVHDRDHLVSPTLGEGHLGDLVADSAGGLFLRLRARRPLVDRGPSAHAEPAVECVDAAVGILSDNVAAYRHRLEARPAPHAERRRHRLIDEEATGAEGD